MKRYYLGYVYNEKTRTTDLVRVSSQGRNLSQKEECPQEYTDKWMLVYAENMTHARTKIAAGIGILHC